MRTIDIEKSMNIITKLIKGGVALWFIFILSSSLSLSQTQQKQIDLALGLKEAERRVEKLETALSQETIKETKLVEIAQKLRETRRLLQELNAGVQPIFEDAQANLSDLGPAPLAAKEGETQVVEPENIEKQRKLLTEELLVVEGLYRQADVLSSRVSRLLEKVASVRRDRFVGQLFLKQGSVIDKSLWETAAKAMVLKTDTVADYVQKIGTHTIFGIVGAVVLFVVFLVFSTRLSAKKLEAQRTNLGDFAGVSHSLIMPAIASAVGLFLVFQTLYAMKIIEVGYSVALLNIAGLIMMLFLVLVGGSRLQRASIIRPSMRWLSTAATALFVLDVILLGLGKNLGVALELAVAQTYIATFLFAVILFFFSYNVLHNSKPGAVYFFPKQFFYFLVGISLCLVLANIFSYAAFSRYLFERFIILSSLFAIVLVLRAIARPYFQALDQLLVRTAGASSEDQQGERIGFFWLSLCLDTILFFMCIPVIANTLGANWQDIQEWALKAFWGFEIGAVTISIANIGIAILVFIALLLATRLVQRLLSQSILPKTNLDEAISQSITQVLGYVGLIIALMAGISVLGFDLTNLALIAGALSVGIGFGLQSIVSNFVSGLILLFERPIKVNDWIITGSGEGIVKKISVRSTEIETFDRTSIIVPNSELISSSVKNWTHKDKTGRVIIPVGVAYHSDLHQVRDILKKCIEENTDALNKPEPSIFFMDFGDSALMFEVRFFIRNIRDIYRVSTDVRFQIWDAFKENDIEISFPQRDIHIRTAEGLKGLSVEE